MHVMDELLVRSSGRKRPGERQIKITTRQAHRVTSTAQIRTRLAPLPRARYSDTEMSKKQFRSQASSGRVGNGLGAFGSSGFGSTQSSPLSYIQELPDYAEISDANAVVAFKNLSKKDSTTKAKALEDIQAYISSSPTEIEDGLLEAWVRRNRNVNVAVDSDECISGQTLSSPLH